MGELEIISPRRGPIARAPRPGAVIGSDDPDAITLGRVVEMGGTFGAKVCYGGERHLVLFGPNGTGKGMRVLVPNALSIKGKSIVFIDPKGQLAAMTAKYRHEQGDDVKIIDPFGVLADVARADPETYRYLIENGLVESVGFNPLAALDPDAPTFYEDAAVIASALIKIEGNDPHWPESAQGLVVGLIMWEKVRNGKNANLENVRQMLTEADEWEEIEGGKKRQVRGLRVTATQMVAHGGFEIESLAGRFLGETDELESIKSTADTQTRWLLSRPMRADLKKNGIDFRSLKEGSRPMSVYVIVPSKFVGEHSIWIRLVVSEALRASLTPGGRRVLLILDELAALGHFQIIEKLWGVARDYRLQMWAIFQDLGQLQRIYKETWSTILGNAGVVQALTPGTGDTTTAEWMSKRAGETTIVTTSRTSGSTDSATGASTNDGLSHQETKVPFLLPHDMFSMREGHSLAWVAGMGNTVPLYSPFYKEIVQARTRALPNPYQRERDLAP